MCVFEYVLFCSGECVFVNVLSGVCVCVCLCLFPLVSVFVFVRPGVCICLHLF